MECPLYFLQCDPNNGGKKMLVHMASNYITKIRKHFYNDMKTFKILRGVKIRESFDF
jgi:hypothetical protein